MSARDFWHDARRMLETGNGVSLKTLMMICLIIYVVVFQISAINRYEPVGRYRLEVISVLNQKQHRALVSFRDAQSYLKGGNAPRAAQCFRESLAQVETKAGYYELGSALTEACDYPGAEEAFTKGLNMAKRDNDGPYVMKFRERLDQLMRGR